jgi:DnaJ-class molecular chaperone
MKYTCKHCNGKGETEKYTELIEVRSQTVWQRTKLCLYCMGKGELDWIENIRGVDRTNAGHLVQIHPSTRWGAIEEDEGEIKYEIK